MARSTLKELLFYGGVSKEEYETIKPLISEENHKVWRLVSIILEILFIGLFVFALVEPTHEKYILSFGILAGLLIIAVLMFLVIMKPTSKILLPFIYVTIAVILGVFIYTGTFVEVGRPTVIFPAIVIGLSFVTLDRPIRYSSLLLTILAAFIALICVFKNRSFEVFITDILDASIFTVAGIFVSVFISTIRCRDLVMRMVAEKDRDTDALTGVSNKLAYDRRVTMISEKMKDGGIKFAVAIFDVNGLKITNDTFGHEQGDKLLVRCCEMIQESLPNTTLYRIGGDEFAAIITGEDYANREKIVREIHEKVDKAHEDSTSLMDDTSIAIGVAVYNPSKDRDFLSVFSRADAEMYDNKRVTKAKNSYLQENK